jgi:hypothetical protein
MQKFDPEIEYESGCAFRRFHAGGTAGKRLARPEIISE